MEKTVISWNEICHREVRLLKLEVNIRANFEVWLHISIKFSQLKNSRPLLHVCGHLGGCQEPKICVLQRHTFFVNGRRGDPYYLNTGVNRSKFRLGFHARSNESRTEG